MDCVQSSGSRSFVRNGSQEVQNCGNTLYTILTSNLYTSSVAFVVFSWCLCFCFCAAGSVGIIHGEGRLPRDEGDRGHLEPG